jgi:REP element-mobilizing transposase RayT
MSAGGAALNWWCYHSRPMSHSYINNYLHIIYSTKDRKNLIAPEFEPRLYSFVAETGREHGIPLIAAGGTANHSHLLILLPATLCLADAVNTLKTSSSRFMSQQGTEFEWQKGYGAFAVSASHVERVKTYIRNQEEHHKKRTFEQEFLAMLKKAGIDYDPRYVFG